MPPYPIFLMLLLACLLFLSVQMATSDFVRGRETFGWIYVLGYLLLYFHFFVAWLGGSGKASAGSVADLLLMCALIIPLGVLVTKLVVLQVMPDPSKGLKLLKPHTEAEKRVVQDDLPGAIEEYEKVLKDNPGDLDARLRMAEVCIEAKQYKKAAETYEAVLKKFPKLAIERHSVVLTQLSEIYGRHIGEIEKARESIQVIIDKYPDSNYAKFAKERLSNL